MKYLYLNMKVEARGREATVYVYYRERGREMSLNKQP